MDALNDALLITAVGMGLVFGGLLLLWLLIWLLVRFTAEKTAAPSETPLASPEAQTLDIRKHEAAQRAAAVAVALAVAQRQAKQKAFIFAPQTKDSTWQTIMRINHNLRNRRGLR